MLSGMFKRVYICVKPACLYVICTRNLVSNSSGGGGEFSMITNVRMLSLPAWDVLWAKGGLVYKIISLKKHTA